MNFDTLLAGMTLRDKILQLTQVNSVIFAPLEGWDATGPLRELRLTKEDCIRIGSTLNSTGAKRMEEIESKYIAENPHKIPLIFMHDVIHGYRTIYPINLGLACSFDLDLIRDCARMAAREAVLDGVHVTFAPMVDLARDARWGRVAESSGEDPYLNSLIAKATVEGYSQEEIGTCVKHFAAYGGAEAGKDYAAADMSEHTLREYYLPAYKAAIDAGADMVMPAFQVLNGIPCTGNRRLLQDILRKEWGFDGAVISDYAAVLELIAHGFAEDEKDAAYQAFTAGVDVEMSSSTYAHNLQTLVQEGKITVAEIDAAVLRVLRLKEKLGILQNPYRRADKEKAGQVHASKEHRALARRAIEESAVLLKNDGILPLSTAVKSIAVIGARGNTGHVFGWWVCDGRAEETVSVYDGLSARHNNVRYVQGYDLASTDESCIQEAVELAASSESVVLCLGEGEEESGESNSKTDLDLPEVQYKLLDAILQVNKNVTVLLFTGRPLAIPRLHEKAPAILNVWWPGTECGNAVSDLLFGNVCPSGKLTMTFPYAVGQCPIYYNHYATGRPLPPGMNVLHMTRYIDAPNEPLYPFGYGLSYSNFEYSPVTLSDTRLCRGGSITASVTLINTGEFAAKETVQLYIRDVAASIVRPVKELKGFEKIELSAGESKRVQFVITEDMLAFYNADMRKCVEAGKFRVFIGANSACMNYAEFVVEEEI